jgi:hypothetical protein
LRAVAHRGSVAARVLGEGPRGAAAAYKGAGVLLGVRVTLGRRVRGGLGGGTGGVRVGDGWRRGMTRGPRLSVAANGGARASAPTGPFALLGWGAEVAVD